MKLMKVKQRKEEQAKLHLNRYSLHDLQCYARSCFAHLTLFPLTVQIPRLQDSLLLLNAQDY